MKTSSKTVTFARSFALAGVDGVQPAGTYTVETDEELLPTVLHPAYRRTATWLALPSNVGAGSTQLFNIDPTELAAALVRDARGGWSLRAEASIDDLLAGEVMKQAMHSAGLTPSEFKEQLRDLATRLGRMRKGKDGEAKDG